MGWERKGSLVSSAIFLRGALGEFGVRVQSGADRRAADGQVVKPVQGLLHALDIAMQQACPAAEFLSEGERHGILQVSAADFYDVLEFFSLGCNRIVTALDSGNQRVLHPFRGCDVHGGGEGIVRRLRHVDVIVGMNRLLRSQHAARQFNGAVGDHLVDVHVGLGAAAGLPDAQRELLVQFAGDDFIGGLGNELGLFGGKLT